jgi:putative nucleotidyltransferase with HDIG domain
MRRVDVWYLAAAALLGGASVWAAGALADHYLAGNLAASIWLLSAVPVAAVPMYTRLALGRLPMLIHTVALATAVGLVPSVLPAFGWQTLAAGLAGGLAVAASTRRGTVVAAGLWSGLGSAAVFLVAHPTEMPAPVLVAGAAGALVGGALSGALVLTLSPLAERLFGHVTSMTLLEALSYDHPLLRQLMTATPGTFLHATHLAVLCDAAAQAIGADALELRAGALYHDVGKTRAPSFFIENQRGENPHDRLSPAESAAILRAHVSDGVDLLERYGLAPRLARFVREHHGTSVMRYFAEKPEAERLDPSVFRYPGPRPQSCDTALLMVADRVEATARSAQPPTLEDCRALVEQTIDRLDAEGQLEESGLTATHRSAIVVSIADMLHAIHHRRIAYPEPKQTASGRPPVVSPAFRR